MLLVFGPTSILSVFPFLIFGNMTLDGRRAQCGAIHGWGGGGRAGSFDTHRVRTTTGHEGSAFSDAVIAGIVSADPVFDNSSIV